MNVNIKIKIYMNRPTGLGVNVRTESFLPRAAQHSHIAAQHGVIQPATFYMQNKTYFFFPVL